MTHWIKIGTRTVALRDEEVAAFARRWIDIGQCTWPADRERFEEAVSLCYALARAPWHGHVVWVSSPLVLTLAVVMIREISLKAAGEARVPQQVRERLSGVVTPALLAAVEEAVAQALSHLPVKAVKAVKSAKAAKAAKAVREAGREQDQGGAALIDPAWLAEHLRTAVRGLLEWEAERSLEPLCQRVDGPVYGAAGALVDVEIERICRVLGCEPPACLPGQLDAGRACLPARTAFLRERCGVVLPGAAGPWAQALEEIAQSGGRWYAHRHFVLACERPQEMHLEPFGRRGEEAQRLHHLDGLALFWPDGWGLHVYHGTRVPAWLIERPQEITVAGIEQESNTEVRRVMLERFGWQRYFFESGATVVDSLPMGHPIVGLRGARLLRKEMPGDEPLVYLEMVNSTAEPDGSYRRYLERIDPKVYFRAAGRLCHAAMASRWLYRDDHGELRRTFENWEDYVPTAES